MERDLDKIIENAKMGDKPRVLAKRCGVSPVILYDRLKEAGKIGHGGWRPSGADRRALVTPESIEEIKTFGRPTDKSRDKIKLSADEALDVLKHIMLNAMTYVRSGVQSYEEIEDWSVRKDAAKTLINKEYPDRKAVDVSVNDLNKGFTAVFADMSIKELTQIEQRYYAVEQPGCGGSGSQEGVEGGDYPPLGANKPELIHRTGSEG